MAPNLLAYLCLLFEILLQLLFLWLLFFLLCLLELNQMILVVSMPAGEHIDHVFKFEFFPAVLTGSLKRWSHNFLCVNLLKLHHLIIDNHLIRKQVEICIFGICYKSAPEWVEHKFFDKNGLVSDYKLWDLLNRYLIADINQAKFQYLC